MHKSRLKIILRRYLATVLAISYAVFLVVFGTVVFIGDTVVFIGNIYPLAQVNKQKKTIKN